MYDKVKTLWKLIISEANRMNSSNDCVVNDNYEMFLDILLTEYQNIKHSYMHSNVEFLDRHKIAAVIIYAIVETKVLKPKVNYINNVYIGNYKLAISAGLSYMQYELNHELIRQDMKPIDQFIFPDTINGNKSYLEYLVNLLYLTEKENELSLLYLLYLANIFFLIEQYTLCMNY